MASGHARVVSEATGKRTVIVGQRGERTWSPLWSGLPWIARPDEVGDFEPVTNGPGARPYLSHLSRARGAVFTSWRARDHLGALRFTQAEKSMAKRQTARLGEFILIEPTVKPTSNPNKRWSLSRWQAVADAMSQAGYRVVQVGDTPDEALAGVRYIPTPNFRAGAAVLDFAALSILPEGGLHHAAGVLKRPAVVLFGGHTPVETTGYPWHTNIAAEGETCGQWKICRHCTAYWESLQPRVVIDAALAALSEQR